MAGLTIDVNTGEIRFFDKTDLGSAVDVSIHIKDDVWRRIYDRLGERFAGTSPDSPEDAPDDPTVKVVEDDGTDTEVDQHAARRTVRMDAVKSDMRGGRRDWMKDGEDWHCIRFTDIQPDDVVEAFLMDGTSVHGRVRFVPGNGWTITDEDGGTQTVISMPDRKSHPTVREPFVSASAYTLRDGDDLLRDTSAVFVPGFDDGPEPCPVCGERPTLKDDVYVCRNDGFRSDPIPDDLPDGVIGGPAIHMWNGTVMRFNEYVRRRDEMSDDPGESEALL